jgi:hypothetical protein
MKRLARVGMSALLVAGTMALVRTPAARAAVLPTLTIGNVSVVEGDAGSAIVNVPVDLSAPSSVKVTVNYVIHGGTATAGSDFVASSGKLTFLPTGPVSKVISVKVLGDTIPEADESVFVDLSNAVNATLANTRGTVTIQDDDSDGKTGLQVSVGDFSVESAAAGKHYAYLPVTLSQPAPSTIKVTYTITCTTAQNGVDFTAQNQGTLTFLKGQQTKLLKFQILPDQTADEVKTILETIKVAKGPVAVDDNTGEATIVDGNPVGDGLPPLPVLGLERESVADDGTSGSSNAPTLCHGGGEGSFGPSVSGDGRYVAFISGATDLVPNDNNGEPDAFVRDRLTGTTERVSVGSDGSEAEPSIPDGPLLGADNATISRDGRYVTFYEFWPLGGYGGGRFFIHDRQTGTTTPIVVDAQGDGIDDSGQIAMSADDRYIVFSACGDSSGTIVPVDPDPTPPPGSGSACDVFRLDRTTNTSVLVSNPPDGSPSDGFAPSISGNGRYVAFWSSNPNYVAGDTNNCTDAFVRDMDTGTFERINITTAGQQSLADSTGECNGWMSPMALSDDGRNVAFMESSWSIVGAPAGQSSAYNGIHIFVRDRVAGTTNMVDPGGRLNNYYPAMSADGAYVSYWCQNCLDSAYYIANVATGDIVRASETANGTQGDATDYGREASTAALSADGRYFVFSTMASNLVNDDDNNLADVFVKRVF